MASNVLGFLSEKNILVTRSTGFLGKIFIEKILRSQPGISSIFVLLRANDAESAKLRFKTEVLKLELFRTLREQHGDSFESFIFQKVVPVVGDIATDHNLGIYTHSSRELLWENLDAIVHIAANTVFDNRYDVSLNVNTKGAKNIVEFAKRCRKLQILVHVSTVDSTVDALEKAYEGFTGAVERILEARESSDAAKTLTTDAALENFKQHWELATGQTSWWSQCGRGSARSSSSARAGETAVGISPISAVRLEQMSRAVSGLLSMCLCATLINPFFIYFKSNVTCGVKFVITKFFCWREVYYNEIYSWKVSCKGRDKQRDKDKRVV